MAHTKQKMSNTQKSLKLAGYKLGLWFVVSLELYVWPTPIGDQPTRTTLLKIKF